MAQDPVQEHFSARSPIVPTVLCHTTLPAMCREQSFLRSLVRKPWFVAMEERYRTGAALLMYEDDVAQWAALQARREAALETLPPLPPEPWTLQPAQPTSSPCTIHWLLVYYFLFFSVASTTVIPLYIFLLLPLEIAFRIWTASTRITLRLYHRGIFLAFSILLARIPTQVISRLLCCTIEDQADASQPAETATNPRLLERRSHGESSWRRSVASSSSD